MAKKDANLIGLDIGSSSIKFVELKRKKDRLVLRQLDNVPLSPETIVEGAIIDSYDLINTLKLLVSIHHIKKRKVAISVSGPPVIVKRITTTYMTEKEFEEIVDWEMERYLPFDLSEVSLGYQIIRADEDKKQLEVLVAAVKKETLEEYVSVVSEGGLTVKVMDVDALAVGNAYLYSREVAGDETILLVNMGATLTNLNVISSGVPTFTRDIALGGDHFTKEIQKRVGVTFERAERLKIGEKNLNDAQDLIVKDILKTAKKSLTNEILQAINFYHSTFEGKGISKIVLSGGTALMNGLSQYIEETLNIPTSIMNVFEHLGINEKKVDMDLLKTSAPVFGVAFGLALRREKEED